MSKDKIVKPEPSNKANITGDTHNNNNIPKNISKIDNAVLSTIRLNPLATNGQIASNVVALGASKYPENVYRRIAQKDYLKREIDLIRNYNRQRLDREIVPDALKYMHKAIRLKTLSDEDKALYKAKEPYIKMAVDKSFGEIRHIEQPSVVNIESINNAQFNIKSDVA